ncbi:polysaccharide pyruvyl transferase family protein [Marinobacter salinexigens]|uniref:Polysaccharide pyruvyl transferase family protein n=1 Tax=Marinobacter salinexigens TaxID=2919747 RepID=A0A5B0VKZ8_9GAMM|nr:polysaccharide pyruvyl transferase family protein [Marinobacter salinexigens]KAA1174659.1 polysaccharide pyruvyl transferase family protein [Marinobacter salinexigens]
MVGLNVSILTQPLGHNYGGLLQAWALQTYLEKIGCEVEILDRRVESVGWNSLKVHLLNLARLMLGRIKSLPSERRQAWAWAELAAFRDHQLKMSPRIVSEHKVREYYRERNFDVFVVGSDQVWRPRYSPSILNFYLDFLDDIRCPAKRIAYAASFGVDNWEYSPKLTGKCKNLARKFDAISVRENSGVDLCQDKLGVSAQCVADPTFLLERAEYESLISKCESYSNPGRVLSYVLDPAPEKRSIARDVGRLLGSEVFSIKPEYSVTDVRAKDLLKCRFPGVERWLLAFRDARFVVTDSFHGTIFSILFNKPFITVGNSTRGLARFESLLSQFGLVERLVESPTEIPLGLVQRQIDWEAVNDKREELSTAGRLFLRTQLLGH